MLSAVETSCHYQQIAINKILRQAQDDVFLDSPGKSKYFF